MFNPRTNDDCMVKECDAMESAREIRVLEVGRRSSATRASGAYMQLKQIAVAAVLGLFASVIMAPEIPALGADNPIVTENQQPGSTGWRLTPPLISDD